MSSALDSAPARPRRGRLYAAAAAAVGCAALAVGWFYLGHDEHKGSNAALGALQQASVTPTVESPLQTPEATPQPAAVGTAPSPQPTLPSNVQPASAAALAANRGSRLSAEPAAPAAPTAPAARGGSNADRAKALVDEGMILLKQGRLGLAESSYQKALQLVPNYPNAMAALVRVHLVRRDGAEAVRWAKQLAATQPGNGSFQLLLGDAQALYGDGDAALKAWRASANAGNATARSRLSEQE